VSLNPFVSQVGFFDAYTDEQQATRSLGSQSLRKSGRFLPWEAENGYYEKYPSLNPFVSQVGFFPGMKRQVK